MLQYLSRISASSPRSELPALTASDVLPPIVRFLAAEPPTFPPPPCVAFLRVHDVSGQTFSTSTGASAGCSANSMQPMR